MSELKDKVVGEFDAGQMSEFLEGHHPVDVTESELLQILLDWLIQFASGSRQDCSNLAAVLLRKIRWNAIRYDDILKVISSGIGTSSILRFSYLFSWKIVDLTK